MHGDDVIPFQLAPRTAKTNGSIAAIICDICATWRRGPESAVITFPKGDRSMVSHLVCADLECSLHVRAMTMLVSCREAKFVKILAKKSGLSVSARGYGRYSMH